MIRLTSLSEHNQCGCQCGAPYLSSLCSAARRCRSSAPSNAHAKSGCRDRSTPGASCGVAKTMAGAEEEDGAEADANEAEGAAAEPAGGDDAGADEENDDEEKEAEAVDVATCDEGSRSSAATRAHSNCRCTA